MEVSNILFTTVLIGLGAHFALSIRKVQQSVGSIPGRTYLLSAANVLGNLLPGVKYVTVGMNWAFRAKYDVFAECGSDVIALTGILPFPKTDLLLADAGAIKEMTTSRARFPKPVEYYTVLNFFGPNIVTTEGEKWKKHRKVSAPAFSDRNNKLVWEEAMQITEEMMEKVWGHETVVHVDNCNDITLPIALFVIGVAAFGKRLSWEDEEIPPGHTMTLKQALHVVTTDFLIKLLIPRWALGLTKRFRRVRDSYDELHQYMREMVIQRQHNPTTARHDLFSNLLEANSGDEKVLDEDEIIGNTYIFLVAGHETTAHTLCFTFALLALYPDAQEKLFEQIKSLMPHGHIPVYEDMPKFTYSMAVFYETLRMFPPLNFIPKAATEDSTLTATDASGQRTTIPVPKGTFITILTPALHYNPRYWKDPHTFKPERFLEDWPRDAFLPFSAGARACIGRKFFETEGVAILTMLVSRYKISVKYEPQFARETFEQRKTRVLSTAQGFTLTPVRVPLTFTRR